MKMPFDLSRFFKWKYVLAGVIVVAVGYYFFVGHSKDLGATLTIARTDFKEQVSVSGTVTAAKDVDLGFAANGRIAATYAAVGQHVEAGAVLAETENGDLAASLAQKQSALKEAQANLSSLEAGTRPEELAVAQTAVTSAQAALVSAIQTAYTTSDDAVHNRADSFFTNPRTNPKLAFSIPNANLENAVEHDRTVIEPMLASWAILISKLTNENAGDSAKQAATYLMQVTTLLADANSALNQGLPDQSISAATLSSYNATLSTARANVNTAATALATSDAALDSAQSTLALKQAGSTTDAIAAQEAVVASAEADIRSAQATLAKTRVVAPFAGTVTRMDAKVGEIVAPTTSEISMQSDGVFQIETYIPEVTIAHVAPHDPATTTLDAYGPSVEFPSVVLAVDPAETLKDGVPTYKTTLSFLSADPRVRSGMTANVVIETGVLPNAIVIPAGAIGAKDSIQYVSVVKNNEVVERTVTTGPSPALGQAEILTGLSEGDVILLAPVP